MAKTKKPKSEKVKSGAQAKPIAEETPAVAEAIADEMIPPAETHAPSEIVTEDKKEHLMTEKEELPLKDEVSVEEKDLPDTNTLEKDPYEPEEATEEPATEVAHSKDKEWVGDAALLKKVEGYKDTLNGTLYYGKLK